MRGKKERKMQPPDQRVPGRLVYDGGGWRMELNVIKIRGIVRKKTRKSGGRF